MNNDNEPEINESDVMDDNTSQYNPFKNQYMMSDTAVTLQLTTNDVVDKMILPFLGYTKVGDQLVQLKDTEPLVNSKGVVGLQPFFSEYNRITFLGKLTEKDLKNFYAEFKRNLATVITKNVNNWELKDKSYRDVIVDTFGRLYYLCGTRALGGEQLNALNKQIHVLQSTSLQERKEPRHKANPFGMFK